MAESLSYSEEFESSSESSSEDSEWSTEVSCFMDLQMCACVLEVR